MAEHLTQDNVLFDDGWNRRACGHRNHGVFNVQVGILSSNLSDTINTTNALKQLKRIGRLIALNPHLPDFN